MRVFISQRSILSGGASYAPTARHARSALNPFPHTGIEQQD